MGPKHTILLFMISLCLPVHVHAQAWTGIINPTRATNWQRANVGVPGGIPTGWTQCGSTIAAYTGTADTINNALAACGSKGGHSNTYVLLGSGTFSLSTGITMSSTGGNLNNNVVLRGSGPAGTLVLFTGSGINCVSGQANICSINTNAVFAGGTSSSASILPPCGGSNSSNCFNWTGGYAQGSTSITVANVGSSNISNGDMITLDQENDTAETSGFLTASCANGGPGFQCATNFHQNAETSSGNGRQVVTGQENSQQQWVVVTAGCSTPCSGSGPFTLTISPGLYANNWNTHNGTAGNAGIGGFMAKPNSGIGIENMSLDNSNGTSRGNIGFYNCNGCWVKNVRSIYGNRNHIWSYQSPRLEVRDSYFFGTQNSSNQSYGIELGEAGGCDQLVENNIFQQVASPIEGGGTCGFVFAYNFAINSVYSPPTYLQGASPSHDASNYFNLYEGNQLDNLVSDDVHGTPGGVMTYFRNRLTGRGYNTCTSSGNCTGASNLNNQPTQQTFPIDLDAYSRGFNIIGNVLGTPGYHTTYEYHAGQTPTAAQCNVVIYELGYGGAICSNNGAGGVIDDTLTAATLMRWGNYDTANAAVRWDAAESSPSATTYIAVNNTPSSQTLPSSFYLASRPSFFDITSGTTPPYPPIGPDVTGGTGPAGLSYNNPAANCYYSVLSGPSDGSGSVLAYNATACYYAAPASSSPGLSRSGK
jgi:hypothetical protein